MCTVTSSEPILCVAKEDIVTYKCVKIKYSFQLFKIIKCFHSLFKNFEYIPNKVYTTKLSKFRLIDGLYCSKNRFYSYKYPNFCNVKCIIPKGSKYYLCKNFYDSLQIYHSDQIKIVSVL